MSQSKVEQVARAIDPSAFRQFESMRDYCLRSGDSADMAIETAQWAHGTQIDEAMEKARAAIEAMREPTEAMCRYMAAAKIPIILHDRFLSDLIDAALNEQVPG